MFYEVVKVFNNNVVLIKNSDGQCVLISKGIGFGKKNGDLVDILAIKETKKIFYTDGNENSRTSIKKLEASIKILENVTENIIKEAYDRLFIQADNLFNGIFDHVVFVVESLKAGIPIQNPFISEIKILCSEEFEIANNASKTIEKELQIKLLDGEKALIALHLHSARKKQNISSVTIDIMVYSKIFELLDDVSYTNESYRSFILSVNSLISSYENNNKYLLTDALIQSIQSELQIYHKKAKQIAKLLEKELQIYDISHTFIALLTVEIYKLCNS
ncbi:MAG: PRD domain-containing protein [Clostridia bacterium]